MYRKLAEAALTKRASVFESMKAIEADPTLTAAEKRSRIADGEAEMAQLETEARGYIERDERESEARSLTVRSGLNPNRSEIETAKGGNEFRAGRWLAEELRAITTGATPGSAFAPTEFTPYAVDFLAAKSIFLASGVRVASTDHVSLTFPHLKADPVVSWADEATQVAPTQGDAESVTITPKKVMGTTVLSNEVIADSDPVILDYAAQQLLRSIALKVDIGAFEGDGTTVPIVGLKNVPNIQTFALATNGEIPTNLDFAADALGMLEEANADAENAVFAMHPSIWRVLTKIKELSGSAKPVLQDHDGSGAQGIKRTLYGRPVFLSSQLSVTETEGTSNAASSILCYDPSQVFAVQRAGIEIFVDPYSRSDSDESLIRGTTRISLWVPNAKAVVRVTGALSA